MRHGFVTSELGVGVKVGLMFRLGLGLVLGLGYVYGCGQNDVKKSCEGKCLVMKSHKPFLILGIFCKNVRLFYNNQP